MRLNANISFKEYPEFNLARDISQIKTVLYSSIADTEYYNFYIFKY